MSDASEQRQHRWTQIETLFHEALEQGPETRADFLTGRCADDDELRGEVERLLAGHENAAHFIEPPAEGFLSSDFANDLDIPVEGKKIGTYALKRVIASGGMGTVYEAEQENPRRSVAIKVLRGGIASRNVLRRFEHEAAVLGHLRHPAIAQVLEAGTHIDEGERRPFIAMEFIHDALLITDYVERNKLTFDDRLRLFAAICDAVHYGHQRGIIHRDLKPANILVDGNGRPKVIDFGVARVLDNDIAVTTVHTGVGQLIGTLTYMSPEQCVGDPHDIDTRSDVYSLGIVLYEILCGRLPYDVRNKAITEVAAMIQDQPPRRPSSINRMLRGDLETITLKAIEKDRNYRYQSAFELATDIRRYLNHEPISARPPSMTYQLRMFARRNRVLVASAAIFVVMVTIGSVVMTSLYLQKAGAMVEVQRQQELAVRNAEAEREQRAKAEKIMVYLKEMLASADPELRPGHETTVREVLDRVAPRLHIDLAGQPEVEAEMHNVIANTYFALGDYESAEQHGRQALAILEERMPDSPEYAKILGDLAAVVTTVGRLKEGKAMFEEALDIRERKLGRLHVDTSRTLDSLAEIYRQERDFDTAERLVRESLSILEDVPDPDPHRRSMSLNCLALILEERGRGQEALRYYDEALSLITNENDLWGATLRNNLAALYLELGDMPKTEALLLESRDIYRRVLGDQHLHVGHAFNNLGVMYTELGRLDEAESVLQAAYEIYLRHLGKRNRTTATCLNNRGSVLVDQKKYDEADKFLSEALELRRSLLPPTHPEIAATLNNLARIALAEERYEDAEKLANEALCIHDASLPPGHPHLAGTIALVGRIHRAMNRINDAIDNYREALAEYTKTRPDTDRRVIDLRIAIGRLLVESGRYDDAESELLSAAQSVYESGWTNPNIETALHDSLEGLYIAIQTNAEAPGATPRAVVTSDNPPRAVGE